MYLYNWPPQLLWNLQHMSHNIPLKAKHEYFITAYFYKTSQRVILAQRFYGIDRDLVFSMEWHQYIPVLTNTNHIINMPRSPHVYCVLWLKCVVNNLYVQKQMKATNQLSCRKALSLHISINMIMLYCINQCFQSHLYWHMH